MARSHKAKAVQGAAGTNASVLGAAPRRGRVPDVGRTAFLRMLRAALAPANKVEPLTAESCINPFAPLPIPVPEPEDAVVLVEEAAGAGPV
ncbi:hypothetical protein ACP70R_009912 [Stipagrostis hirtigluma subsp. patula]